MASGFDSMYKDTFYVLVLFVDPHVFSPITLSHLVFQILFFKLFKELLRSNISSS